jgi:hypothetical protein
MSETPRAMMDMELTDRANNAAVTSAVEDGDSDGYNRDDRDLIRLGKMPVLKVSR